MHRIVQKQVLSEDVCRFEVEAPVIARKRKAGQFIILRTHEEGERIPLTIADSDPQAGTITLIVQAVGKTTRHLNSLEQGDAIMDVAGPLGMPTHVEKFGTVVPVGGGIGIAVAYPIAKAMKEAGNRVVSIIGARNKDLLILEDDVRATSDETIVTTDDGSYGVHGFVTDALQQVIERESSVDLVLAIGPLVMMNAVCNLTRESGIKTLVSLNPIMIDGTGMCGGCRITYDGKPAFVCVDGPEFDGHLVDFKELGSRLGTYRDAEQAANDHYCELLKRGRDS